MNEVRSFLMVCVFFFKALLLFVYFLVLWPHQTSTCESLLTLLCIDCDHAVLRTEGLNWGS